MGTVLTFAELARQKAKAEKKAERRRAELGLEKKEKRGKKAKRSKKQKERRRRKSEEDDGGSDDASGSGGDGAEPSTVGEVPPPGESAGAAAQEAAEARRLKGPRGTRTLLPTKNCIHGLRGRLGSSRSCATRLR